jgi:ribosomal protein S18 acetylase RimI-like enzyme
MTMVTPEVPISTLVRQAGDALIGLYRHAPGFEARLTRHTWLVASGEPHLFLNWVAVIEPGSPATAALRDDVASLRARGLPALVFLAPAAAEALAPVCRSLGLAGPEAVPLMTRKLADLGAPGTAAGVEIVPVRDATTLRTAVALLAAVFAIPPDAAAGAIGDGLLAEPAIEVDAARRQGQVVGVAITSRAGALVYVDLMATAAANRRQGIGRALLGHVLARHAAAGATHAFLIATEAGRRLYERLGFRIAGEGAIWEVPPTVAGDQPRSA